MAKRLDRLSRQFERLERDQHILIETVALYVRYYLTVSTPVPEAHQEAARAQGKLRFSQFVEPAAGRGRGAPQQQDVAARLRVGKLDHGQAGRCRAFLPCGKLRQEGQPHALGRQPA